MTPLIGTPNLDGFRMPAEYERHRNTWLLWPERRDNWRKGAIPAQEVFSQVASVISNFERVVVGASSDEIAAAHHRLKGFAKVVEIEYDDAWIRDTGPTGLVDGNGAVRAVDWEFNSWGGEQGLFPSWENDNAVARQVIRVEQLDSYKSDLVLEGGAIIVDGEGTAITTEECLLNPNRNPGKTKFQIEDTLHQFLGVDKIIWLRHGLYLDEAGGHVDNICCFLGPGVVALAWTNDASDPQYDISHEALEILSASTDAKNRPLEIIKLHQPDPLFIRPEEIEGLLQIEGSVSRQVGDRLPATYVNFYFVNGGLIMPLFGDPMDLAAMASLQDALPNRKVIGVHARELLLGGGGIHCVTQQIPFGLG